MNRNTKIWRAGQEAAIDCGSTVSTVVLKGLCTGCGTCVVACERSAITMRETPAGLLEPRVNDARCSSCGACLHICPGQYLEPVPIQGPEVVRGSILGACLAHASSEKTRSGGQSGGATTALATYLLDSRAVSACATTVLPADGSLRATGVVARDQHTLAEGQKSEYCPSATVAALAECLPGDEIAFIGLPCHMHGIESLHEKGRLRGSLVRYRIGLVCERTLMGIAIDLLAHDVGVASDSLLGVVYRDKSRRGWPGELAFDLTTGERVYGPNSLRQRRKDCVTPPRCRVCLDKLNVMADVVAGDPWGLADSPEGQTVLLIRTEAGQFLVEAAAKAGYLVTEPIDSALVLECQGVMTRLHEYEGYRQAKGPRHSVASVGSLEGEPPRVESNSGSVWHYRFMLTANSWVARAGRREVALRRARVIGGLLDVARHAKHLAVNA
jgi:coenzyme F420 hydrogenase subunit beta